jgi:hypothetical protein
MEERESGEGTRKKKKLTSRSHALERLLEMCCSNSFNIQKSSIGDHQYHFIGDELLVSYWRCSNRTIAFL